MILGKTHAKHFPDFSLVQTESLEMIRMLAQSGQGIAILPERIARLNGGDLEVYDPKLPVFLDEIYLAYRKEALSSRAGKELIRLAHINLEA